MPQDENRVFDVSKPHKTTPSPTSKPVIVGHHPQMTDPMVNEQRTQEPYHAEHAPEPAHIPITVQDGNGQTPLMEHHTPDDKGQFFAPAEPQAAQDATPEPAAIYPQQEQPDSHQAFSAPNAPGAVAPPPAPDTPAMPPTPEIPVVPSPPVDPGPPMNDLPLPSHHNGGHEGHTHPHQTVKQPADSSKLLWVLAVLILLAGIYAIVDATTSILPYHIFNKTNTASGDTAASVTTSNTNTASVDPTANWTPYINSVGKFSLKYPTSWSLPSDAQDCPNSVLLLGANEDAVGTCNSKNTGQMAIGYTVADARSQFDLNPVNYSNLVTTPVTVDGVTGQEETGIVTNADAEGKPAGTAVTQYVFYTNKITYGLAYAVLANQPNALSDFNLMVTKTLKFNS